MFVVVAAVVVVAIVAVVFVVLELLGLHLLLPVVDSGPVVIVQLALRLQPETEESKPVALFLPQVVWM